MHAFRLDRTLSRLSRTTLLLMITVLILGALQVIVPVSATAATQPGSCAEVRQQNPAAVDGEYALLLQGRFARIYCADMAGTPKEYVSLAVTGPNVNYSFFEGDHTLHRYQAGLVPGTDAHTSYLKIRIDPATLVVDQNDVTFANLISTGASGYDWTNPTFKPVPLTAAYATASDCYVSWSARGRGNVNLIGTDFAIDDGVTFAVGGWAANGSITMDPNRQVVNLTGGGWCGGAGPTGSLKLKLITPAIDQAPPVTSATAPAGWQNHDVTVTLSATDDQSGVAATYWKLDNSPVQQGTSLMISAEGAHSLAFWSVDQVGNVEPTQTAVIQIDRMAPFIQGRASTIDWTNQPVIVTFTCQDALSGVQYCPDPITVRTEGAYQSVTGDAVDNAGNSTNAMVGGIKIDLTAPTITGSVDRAANAAGWYNAPVHLNFACSDTLSGVRACQGPLTVSTEGANQSASGSVTDRAGNTAGMTIDGINIDLTAPTIVGTTDRAANAAGWFNAPVSVSFRCDDALSGVAMCANASTLNTEGANQSVTGSATDVADNTASGSVSGINIDLTAPTVSFTGNAGTYLLDELINITCSASDSLSGVASTTCQTISGPAYTFAQGANSFSATATDRAGNLGSAATSFNVVASFDSLCSLTRQFVTKEGVAKALCAKLDNAEASAARGNQSSKLDQIGGYIDLVQSQSGKALTVNQAEILIRLARTL